MAEKKEGKKKKIKGLSYFKESISELKKVSWPTAKETARLTVIVVIISAVVASFLGFFDYIFNEAMDLIIR